jgi:hypothetical protein
MANADLVGDRSRMLNLAVMKRTVIYRYGHCCISKSPFSKRSNDRAINAARKGY